MLGLAVVIVIAVLVSRAGSTARGRQGPAVVVIVASFIVIGVSGAAIVTAASGSNPPRSTTLLAIVAPRWRHAPSNASDVEALVEVQVGAGPWLALAGGAWRWRAAS